MGYDGMGWEEGATPRTLRDNAARLRVLDARFRTHGGEVTKWPPSVQRDAHEPCFTRWWRVLGPTSLHTPGQDRAGDLQRVRLMS